MERDGFLSMNGHVDEESKERSPSSSRSGQISPLSSVNGGGVNCIYHTVTKFDTLAGVAIKYGVEVADINKLNGLVTDLQMFALKTLRIPLPGRHPPSSILSNGHEIPQRTSSSDPPSRRNSDLFDSFQSLTLRSSSERKVSPAMNSLRGYYGLKSEGPKTSAEGSEMSRYHNHKGEAHYLEDFPFSKSNPPLSHHRKSRSVAYGLTSENGDLINSSWLRETETNDSDKWIEKFMRRHRKASTDFNSQTPEKILKEENNINTPISSITGKGLALRPKSGTRTVSGGADGESSGQNNTIPLSFGDSFSTELVSGVRKSSSTPSLQDSDNGALSSLWPTSKWNLKPDFQAFSASAIARPIFDGLPKPMNRKNKAALD